MAPSAPFTRVPSGPLPHPCPPQLINGLPVDDILGDGSLASWTSIIDPLLAGGNASSKPARAGKAGRAARFPRKDATFKHDL